MLPLSSSLQFCVCYLSVQSEQQSEATQSQENICLTSCGRAWNIWHLISSRFWGRRGEFPVGHSDSHSLARLIGKGFPNQCRWGRSTDEKSALFGLTLLSFPLSSVFGLVFVCTYYTSKCKSLCGFVWQSSVWIQVIVIIFHLASWKHLDYFWAPPKLQEAWRWCTTYLSPQHTQNVQMKVY